jgi:hypothetical protein
MKKGRIKKRGAKPVTFDVVAGAGQVDDNLTGTPVALGFRPKTSAFRPTR